MISGRALAHHVKKVRILENERGLWLPDGGIETQAPLFILYEWEEQRNGKIFCTQRTFDGAGAGDDAAVQLRPLVLRAALIAQYGPDVMKIEVAER